MIMLHKILIWPKMSVLQEPNMTYSGYVQQETNMIPNAYAPQEPNIFLYAYASQEVYMAQNSYTL